MSQRISLRRPDDWHVHFRDGPMLSAVVPETARHFARGLVMPNLVPPVVTGADAAAYRGRILAALDAGAAFQPQMTLYLTEATDADDLVAAHAAGLVRAVKLYPAGATTNSASGVRDITTVLPVLERMAEAGIILAIHGEVTRAEVDIFDREAVFIEEVLAPLLTRIPGLRVVLEHITTADAVDFVGATTEGLAATITAHHLMINRTDILAGGVRPHYYCLPVAKRETHRLALRAAATSGDPRFFFGSDSAPHTDSAKLAPCGCAGCFTAPVALACLAQVFDEEGRLDALEGFLAEAGADWYGLPRNTGRVVLEKDTAPPPWPARVETGAGPVTVFAPPRPVAWRVVEMG